MSDVDTGKSGDDWVAPVDRIAWALRKGAEGAYSNAALIAEALTQQDALDDLERYLRAVCPPAGWCHRTPDDRGWGRYHDDNSVHIDGCVALYTAEDAVTSVMQWLRERKP